MNPQPPQSVGMFVSIISILIIAYNAIKMYNSLRSSNESMNYDLFNLGIVESSPVLIQNFITQPVDNDLYNDCINILIKLGYSKKQAQKKVKFTFNKNPPKNITDFLHAISKK